MHNVSSFIPFYRTFVFPPIEQNGSYIIHLLFTVNLLLLYKTKETFGQPNTRRLPTISKFSLYPGQFPICPLLFANF